MLFKVSNKRYNEEDMLELINSFNKGLKTISDEIESSKKSLESNKTTDEFLEGKKEKLIEDLTYIKDYLGSIKLDKNSSISAICKAYKCERKAHQLILTAKNLIISSYSVKYTGSEYKKKLI